MARGAKKNGGRPNGYRFTMLYRVAFRVLLGFGALSLGCLGAVALSPLTASGAAPRPVLSLPPNQPAPRTQGAGGGVQASVGWSSSNWSGYAETSSSPYTGVSGTWTVPTVSCSGGGSSYSAAWLGIDGFNNDSLIQTGTEQDCNGSSASYSAWWTTSAQGFEEQTITSGCSTTGSTPCGTVHAGDAMSAVISDGTSAGQNQSSSSPNPSGGSNDGDSTGNGQGWGHQSGSQGDGGTSAARSLGGPGGRGGLSSTTTTVSTSTNSTTQGTSVKYSATVSGGSSTPTGTVSFAAGSTALCQATLSNGTGSCNASTAPVGNDTITGTYSGDSTHHGSSGSTSLTVSSSSSSSTSWSITLSDTTQGWTFTETLSYKGPGASAEWIIEAPTVGNRIGTLANYGSTEFDLAAINGGSANAGLVSSDAGDLVTSGRHASVISIPSGPDSAGDAFNIAYGSVAPSAPSS